MKQPMPTESAVDRIKENLLASFSLLRTGERHRVMMKTFDLITEAVRNPKHPFRKLSNQPKKAQKHRYERRKIKEYLHLGDWLEEEAA